MNRKTLLLPNCSIVILVMMLNMLSKQSVAQNTSVLQPDPNRFDKEIEAFMDYDAKNSFPKDAVLFVGSSSIRLWKTHQAFPKIPVINRGFGGSHISDVSFFYETVVKKYQPRIVVFYAGDNDIAWGKSPVAVLQDFKIFVQKLVTDLSQCRLVYLPIKPSTNRWSYWPRMRRANQLVKDYCDQNAKLHCVDTATPMLNETGEPLSDIFLQDGLHLNEKGYDIWNQVLRSKLMQLYQIE
ncbi:MAG: hypothetical protein GF313_10885 [Caldithrix sp.]|nr:hypothetical protein [Caldithrix sp.]